VLKLYKKEGQSLKDFNILLIAGDKDPVGNMGKGVLALEKWYNKQGASVKCKLYSGARHEYLNDICADNSREDIASFVLGFSK
jgi:alpha-beta hydrolase superfamily lysophospholipase